LNELGEFELCALKVKKKKKNFVNMNPIFVCTMSTECCFKWQKFDPKLSFCCDTLSSESHPTFVLGWLQIAYPLPIHEFITYGFTPYQYISVLLMGLPFTNTSGYFLWVTFHFVFNGASLVILNLLYLISSSSQTYPFTDFKYLFLMRILILFFFKQIFIVINYNRS